MFEDFKEIDINDISSWPSSFKVLLVALLCIAIVALTWWFAVNNKRQPQLEALERKEQVLKEQFLEKNKLAVNEAAYREQMNEAENMFLSLKEQLPSEDEIPDLLEDVTQNGLSRGLQFQKFQPAKEVARDFYVEKPVNINVTGSYHQLAEFVSDVAEMPRIVSVDDFRIAREDDGDLKMMAVTKTYYYDEVAIDNANAQKRLRERKNRR